MQTKDYIECGQIIGTHGVRGELKIEPWADSLDYLLSFDTFYLRQGETPLTITRLRPHKGALLLQTAEITTLEQAQALRGEVLYIHRDDDPEENLPFVQDYFGLQVFDVDTGQDYGTIEDVIFSPAHAVFVLVDEKGVQRLIPDIDLIIRQVDLANGTMRIRPLEGLFDLEN